MLLIVTYHSHVIVMLQLCYSRVAVMLQSYNSRVTVITVTNKIHIHRGDILYVGVSNMSHCHICGCQ